MSNGDFGLILWVYYMSPPLCTLEAICRSDKYLERPPTSVTEKVADRPFIPIHKKFHFKENTPLPIYVLSPNRETAGRLSSTQDENVAPRPRNWPPQLCQQRKYFAADRFIPRRRQRNFDGINYYLTKVPPRSENTSQLDVFGQIASLETTWRKELMKKAMIRANVIPGLGDHRVFNFTERENRRRIVDMKPEQNWGECLWKSKARNKRLIDRNNVILKCPSSRVTWLGEILDWGAKNFIAVGVDTSIIIFHGSFNSTGTNIGKNLANLNDLVVMIKWNHAGDRLAVVIDGPELIVLSLEKICWNRKCACTQLKPPTFCVLEAAAWSHTDEEIVACCDKGRVSCYTSSGDLIRAIFPDQDHLISGIAFSPNDRYLAVATVDTFRIYTWPSLTPFLEIGPSGDSEFIKSMAWHPWEMNILCTGGCPQADTLSLWDIHRQKLLGSKKAASVWYINEFTWNKLSGELVVQWNYMNQDRISSVVAVLSSLDRIVDSVSTEERSSCLAWSPDNTQLAVRRKSHIKIYNFFGDETKKWRNLEEDNNKRRKQSDAMKHRRAIYTDQTIHFEHYNIR